MPLFYTKFYTKEQIDKYKDAYYVFGDNDLRKGKGGQAAVCRGKPNTIGIRVKKKPSNDDDAFYTDKELAENKKKIKEDIKIIKKKLKAGYIVTLPLDGIGTGRAQLKLKAPKTYAYLRRKLQKLIEKY